MKPYGVAVVEYPDKADIKKMGSRSSVGKYPNKSGECRSSFKSSASKARTRRYWARKARRENKAACVTDT